MFEFRFLQWWLSSKPGYRSSALIGGKFIFQKNPLQDFPTRINAVISTNERNEFITDRMTYNPA